MVLLFVLEVRWYGFYFRRQGRLPLEVAADLGASPYSPYNKIENLANEYPTEGNRTAYSKDGGNVAETNAAQEFRHGDDLVGNRQ